MKKILYLILVSGFVTLSSYAQESIWHTDMGKASEIAIQEKKPLLMFFTGSDWCGWCTKLQNEVLKTSDFQEWAKENVVLVELDFPRRTKLEKDMQIQNQQLQNMFQVRGYPTIVFANPEKTGDGKMNLQGIGKTGFVRGGAKKWLAVANDIIKVN